MEHKGRQTFNRTGRTAPRCPARTVWYGDVIVALIIPGIGATKSQSADSQGLRPGSSLLARTHAEGNLHREIARPNRHLHWALFLHYRARKSKFTNWEQLRHRPRRARYPDHNPHYPRLKTHSGSVEERNRREIELAAIFSLSKL